MAQTFLYGKSKYRMFLYKKDSYNHYMKEKKVSLMLNGKFWMPKPDLRYGYSWPNRSTFTIVGEPTAKAVWDKLCANYESKSASNKVYLMKKLFDMCMKEGTNVTTHLNDFNVIFTQLVS